MEVERLKPPLNDSGEIKEIAASTEKSGLFCFMRIDVIMGNAVLYH